MKALSSTCDHPALFILNICLASTISSIVVFMLLYQIHGCKYVSDWLFILEIFSLLSEYFFQNQAKFSNSLVNLEKTKLIRLRFSKKSTILEKSPKLRDGIDTRSSSLLRAGISRRHGEAPIIVTPPRRYILAPWRSPNHQFISQRLFTAPVLITNLTLLSTSSSDPPKEL